MEEIKEKGYSVFVPISQPRERRLGSKRLVNQQPIKCAGN